MATVVVPFRAGGKSRLPAEIRVEVALAMLGDVLEAASSFGPARLVTSDEAAGLVARDLGVEVVADPGGGQGAAVQAALAGLDGPCLVVNADVPRVRPLDLTALAIPPRAGAVAIAAAPDGTTNALGLPYAGLPANASRDFVSSTRRCAGRIRACAKDERDIRRGRLSGGNAALGASQSEDPGPTDLHDLLDCAAESLAR